MIVLPLFLISLASSALCGVPVLVWETNPTNEKPNIIPALSQLDSNDFSNFMVKKVHVHKPLIVLFEEETLSIEDFSWQDSQHRGSFPKLQNLTGMSSKVQFIPSVIDPIGGLMDLVRTHDYVWKKYDKNLPTKSNVVLEVKMKGPLSNEDRPDLLRRHDTDIAEIYSQLLASHSRIIALFTGKHSSWVEVDMNRVRREAEEQISAPKTEYVYENKRIKLASKKETVLKTHNETYNLGTPRDVAGIDERENFTRIILTFSAKGENASEKTGITTRYRFVQQNNQWNFNQIEVVVDGITNELTPGTAVAAKMGTSFRTNNKIVFKDTTGDVTITFDGLQAELFSKLMEKDGSKDFSSPDQEEAVFFTAAIWSGLITSFLLIMILTYGFLMLSDIKTMDRFDDPKGKTIQVGGHE